MKEMAFNLLEEPWIRVLRPDCSVEEVSLTDALLRAQDYADLAGELPTQDAAVLRLLLAVLHAVFARVDVDGRESLLYFSDGAPAPSTDEALVRWRSLWTLGRFPEKPIRDYLSRWRERFWLFHPERPFWQVPEAKIGTEYTVAKLNGELLESGNNDNDKNKRPRLFSAYAGASKWEMGYAQAARWLLYTNGFDDASAKPKGKGLPAISPGWLGRLGLIQAQGNSLFETLMLNLTLLQDGASLWGPPRPCWELDVPRSGERTEIAQPDNPAELLTLQSRRLLLHREGDRVTGYALLGDLGTYWRLSVTEEIGRCQKLANAVGQLADDIARAAGDRTKDLPQTAKAQFYFQIDQPFRQWLCAIDPEWEDGEAQESLCAWQKQAQRIAREQGVRMAEQAGPAAFAGRSIDKAGGKGKKDDGEKVFYATPAAYNRFLNQVRAIYAEGGT